MAKQSLSCSTWVGRGSSKTSSLKLVGGNTVLMLTTTEASWAWLRPVAKAEGVQDCNLDGWGHLPSARVQESLEENKIEDSPLKEKDSRMAGGLLEGLSMETRVICKG